MRKKAAVYILALAIFLCGCAAGGKALEKEYQIPDMPQVTKYIPEPTPAPLLPVELVTYEISEDIFAPATEQGTVVTVEYETRDYRYQEDEPVIKQLSVYLPYGYNAAKKYDVLFLMHVSGANHNYWFNTDMYYASRDKGYILVNVKNMVDNMIERGQCAPCILVSTDGFLYDSQRAVHDTSTAYSQFSHELGNDIMPYVVENFATYAEGSSREEIAAAREHFGFMGASYGAYMGYISVMPDNYDLIASYGISGASRMDYYGIYNTWERRGTQDLPMKYLYIGTGALDDRAGPEGSYFEFMRQTDKFSEDNLHFSLYTNTAHEPREWINSLYNCLQLFFRES